MTIIINKEILIAHGICTQDGIDRFVNVLGNGNENFEMPFDDALSYLRNIDLPQQEKVDWYMFVKGLKDQVSFYEMQGAVTMQEKYHVFNTMTGQYEEALTLEDARTIQQRIKDEFIAENAGLFVISQEAYVPEEDRSLWKVVE